MIVPPWWPSSAVFPAALHTLAIALAVAAQAFLLVYAGHRYLVLWRWWRAHRRVAAALVPPRGWPRVTVQLPVYNERLVVERLITAAAALDYPRDRLEIQVLDDSSDETRARAASAVAAARARGVDIVHRVRDRRIGWKAGALADGLACARGELIAVLDADFVPAPDFLRRIVPHFEDPAIGMVQARWGHLNRDRSLLTRAQAGMLDAHFLLEHGARQGAGLFFNFNGTAGVWRRRCIEDAGGWSHDTLTEDLDLSYRAQLAGWRFGFDAAVVAPAELPGTIAAFRSQQFRWAKGSIQTARKLLPRVWASRLPARVRLEAFIHLTANAAYPLLLVLALLLPAALLATGSPPPWLALAVPAGVFACGTLPVVLFLWAGQVVAGRGRDAPLTVAAALVLGAGMSLHNARAVVEGLGGTVGEWVRTPKSGDGHARARGPLYTLPRGRAGAGELALAAWCAGAGALALATGEAHALPFLALFTAGFGAVGAACCRAAPRGG